MGRKLAIAILVVIAAVAAGTAFATTGFLITTTPIARGTLDGHFKIKLQDSATPGDVAVVQITQGVGGNSGWHSHPGPAILVVKSGQLTIEQADCSSKTYAAGQVAIEPTGLVHRASNSGATTLEFWVTFLDVPVGMPPRIDAADPGC